MKLVSESKSCEKPSNLKAISLFIYNCIANLCFETGLLLDEFEGLHRVFETWTCNRLHKRRTFTLLIVFLHIMTKSKHEYQQ